MPRAAYEAQSSVSGALFLCSPQQVIDKMVSQYELLHHNRVMIRWVSGSPCWRLEFPKCRSDGHARTTASNAASRPACTPWRWHTHRLPNAGRSRLLDDVADAERSPLPDPAAHETLVTASTSSTHPGQGCRLRGRRRRDRGRRGAREVIGFANRYVIGCAPPPHARISLHATDVDRRWWIMLFAHHERLSEVVVLVGVLSGRTAFQLRFGWWRRGCALFDGADFLHVFRRRRLRFVRLGSGNFDRYLPMMVSIVCSSSPIVAAMTSPSRSGSRACARRRVVDTAEATREPDKAYAKRSLKKWSARTAWKGGCVGS
jgi:hypothetical protein